MWESIKHGKGWTTWRRLDPEGRTIYRVTTDRDGISVEPANSGYYTLTIAHEVYSNTLIEQKESE